jgi:hypothetical protein
MHQRNKTAACARYPEFRASSLWLAESAVLLALISRQPGSEFACAQDSSAF